MTPEFRTARAVAAGLFACAPLIVVFRQAEAAPPMPPAHPQPAALEQVALAPLGFIDFEMRYPDEVRDSAPAFAAPAQIDTARTINDIVNANVIWRDTKLWTIAPDEPSDGDCKTYALTKRHDLRLRGVPTGALRLAVVLTPRYRALHMVLELRTVDGVYVLDSLTNDSGDTFYRAAAIPSDYTILEYQAWGTPEHWLAPAVLTSQ
jgi:predicted transglutaminase-like cysteine proteinase